MNPPTTLPEALEQIEELKREVKYTQTDYTDAKRDAEKLQDEMEDLRGSCGSPAELQAFGDKWAKLRNGFIGHAACNLTFATMDHQGKRYTAHGNGLLEAISRCEENFAKGIFCRTSIQPPVHA